MGQKQQFTYTFYSNSNHCNGTITLSCDSTDEVGADIYQLTVDAINSAIHSWNEVFKDTTINKV